MLLLTSGFGNKCLTVTYFRMEKTTLSSALSGFTSEFEMGSGGAHSLLPSSETVRHEEINLHAIFGYKLFLEHISTLHVEFNHIKTV